MLTLRRTIELVDNQSREWGARMLPNLNTLNLLHRDLSTRHCQSEATCPICNHVLQHYQIPHERHPNMKLSTLLRKEPPSFHLYSGIFEQPDITLALPH